jgi:hypothetical protein
LNTSSFMLRHALRGTAPFIAPDASDVGHLGPRGNEVQTATMDVVVRKLAGVVDIVKLDFEGADKDLLKDGDGFSGSACESQSSIQAGWTTRGSSTRLRERLRVCARRFRVRRLHEHFLPHLIAPAANPAGPS